MSGLGLIRSGCSKRCSWKRYVRLIFESEGRIKNAANPWEELRRGYVLGQGSVHEAGTEGGALVFVLGDADGPDVDAALPGGACGWADEKDVEAGEFAVADHVDVADAAACTDNFRADLEVVDGES